MNLKTNQMTRAAMFAGIFTVLAQIIVPLPITPIPITLQTLGIMACAVALPPSWALFSVFLYVFMGAIGLPVFAGLSGGVARIAGPTGGFIIGWFPAVLVMSSLTHSGSRQYLRLVCGMFFFTLITYSTGLLWFMLVMQVNFPKAIYLTTLPFLPGDALKCIIITFLYPVLIKLKK